MKEVFDAHPKVNVIFVVNGQPFLVKKDAENYAASKNLEIDEIIRQVEGEKKTESPVEGEPNQVVAEPAIQNTGDKTPKAHDATALTQGKKPK